MSEGRTVEVYLTSYDVARMDNLREFVAGIEGMTADEQSDSHLIRCALTLLHNQLCSSSMKLTS